MPREGTVDVGLGERMLEQMTRQGAHRDRAVLGRLHGGIIEAQTFEVCLDEGPASGGI